MTLPTEEKSEGVLPWDLSFLRFLASHSRSLDLFGLSFALRHRLGFFLSQTSCASSSMGLLLLLREEVLGLARPRRGRFVGTSGSVLAGSVLSSSSSSILFFLPLHGLASALGFGAFHGASENILFEMGPSNFLSSMLLEEGCQKFSTWCWGRRHSLSLNQFAHLS